MKKIFTLTIVLFFITNFSFAVQIDEIKAKQIGKAFLQNKTKCPLGANELNLNLISKVHHNSTSYYYVFNVNAIGFVIVAADDQVSPVLGYSYEGVFDPNAISQSTQKWLEEYKNQIRFVIENNIPATEEIKIQWTNLKSETNSNYELKVSVAPLLLTKWNQSPYVNAQCPSSSVTGCVATGMAQIMKYWNYPAQGAGFHSYNHDNYGTLSVNFGSTTYDWASMPNNVNSPNAAVATLMYHCGVSVDMDYSPQSSGAYVIENSPTPQACSEYALKTYFGYKTTLDGVQRINYTQTNWMNLVKAELNASRPILYAGFGSGGGHCFVADGYDDNDFIHMNWGWGGAYDGYFQINALNPAGLGTGGGSGGFNTGHQAVIGIEPPATVPTYAMALYNYVTPSATSIYYGQSFDVSTNIVNNSNTNFSGDYTAAVFDAQFNFVEYIQTISSQNLAIGNHHINELVFSSTGMLSMLPGTYYIGIFYRPNGENWMEIENNGAYTNYVQIDVNNPNDLELYSEIAVSPGLSLTQGQGASVTVNVINDGAQDFIGEYSVDLFQLDGTFAQTINVVNENTGLPPTFSYQDPFLNFSTSSISVEPGTYLMAVMHNENNTGWELSGSSYFQNPIKVTVSAPGLVADMYEVNNTYAQAYNLQTTFSNNSANITTDGTNIHVETDIDYFKVVLEPGYDYTLNPRIHDSYNAGNGNSYSVDALFSYSNDGINWSDVYDDVLPASLHVGPSTVYFKIAPYFAGETGTYLFDLGITRTSFTGINEAELSNKIQIFPNPTKDKINVNFEEFDDKISTITFATIQGELIQAFDLTTNFDKKISFPLANVASGIYLLQVHTEKGILTKKIIVSK
jgi:hypothetical protein